MNSRGSLQRKCVKATPRQPAGARAGASAGTPGWSCPAAPTAPAGSRPWAATPPAAALAAALARHAHGLALDPAKLTLNQYLDRWLVHVRISLRARTVARYAALLRDHVRPSLGARPLKQLTPLEVQAVYDRLAIGGRRDGKPGGLAPSTSWPYTAACTARWPRQSPGGWSQPTSPPMPPHRQCPPPRW